VVRMLFKLYKRKRVVKMSSPHYIQHKEKARELACSRVFYFNKLYNLYFNRIAIRNQRRVWGSCSGKGNLNFNYRIILLPAHLADYIIVHELCHLKELNHSKKFWELVSLTFPNYKEARKELKNYRFFV